MGIAVYAEQILDTQVFASGIASRSRTALRQSNVICDRTSQAEYSAAFNDPMHYFESIYGFFELLIE